MSKSEISGWLLGKTAKIELTTKGRNEPKTVRLTLYKAIDLLEWHLFDYSEEAHDR